MKIFIALILVLQCAQAGSCILPAKKVQYYPTFEMNGKQYPLKQLPRSKFVKLKIETLRTK